MTLTSTRKRRILACAAGLIAAGLLVVGCGSDEPAAGAASTDETAAFSGTVRVSAIPDQDPEKLTRTYGLVSDYLEGAVPGVRVEYVPVTDYQASVAAFRTGDLDLVWFGGLTGVQARNEVPEATAIAQRDIDAAFTSVFIGRASAGIAPISTVGGLKAIAGRSFTFGSESSTSGRVMPQYFLSQAGVDVDNDLKGDPGFSGTHDKTIELVAAGTFETGALNSQVWDAKVADGTVDASEVVELFRTPPYNDYHWVLQPGLDETRGAGFSDAVEEAILALDGDTPEEEAILAQFGAGAFIPTTPDSYRAIEDIAKQIGVIRAP